MARSHGRRVPLVSAASVSRRAVATVPLEKLLLPNDQFTPRHLGPSTEQVKEMCAVIDVKDVNELMDQAIPAGVRREIPAEELPSGELGEAGSLAVLKEMLSKNVIAKNF